MAEVNLLSDLRNVGPAALADFKVLGVSSIAQLKTCDADELYHRLQVVTGSAHDPCVCDVFAAAIHQAKTGEAKNWWAFTAERKRKRVPK